MARVNAPLLAFNRGEVSKLALARVDIEKLRLAAECQLNWEPKVLGSMGLRPGLEYVGEVLNDSEGRLLPFVFSVNDTATLELTDGKLRIRVDDELVTRTSVLTVVGDSNFVGSGAWVTTDTTSGATTTIGSGVCTLTATPVGGLARAKRAISVGLADIGKEHGLRFVVTNGPVTVRAGTADGTTDLLAQSVLDTGEHALTLTPTTATIYLQIESTDRWAKTLTSVTIDAAGTLEIPTPWAQDDLVAVRQTQSGDIIFTACYGKAQYKIERRSTRGWGVVLYRSSDGPFQTSPGIEANFTPGNYYGNTTLASDQPYFQTGHVGCLFRLFSSGQFNKTVLGANNAYSPAVRVTGVGAVARNYTWTITGTFVGTLTLQRSFDGPDSGFTDVSTATAPGTLASATGSSAATPDLDNAIAWERIGFKGTGYTSGSATVISDYAGGGGFAIVRVTGFTSPTSVNIEILKPFPTLTATSDWLEQDWSAIVGYPTAVGFHEGRLDWTGRDAMWFSRSNNYTSYAEQDLQGNALGDSGAILEKFGEGPVDIVNWVLTLTRPLFGREGSIASARSSSFDEPLTPTNFSVKDCSTQGAARLPAFKIDKRGIFVAQSGRVYELVFDPQALDYTAHNLTRLNEDIYAPGFKIGDVARQPDTAIYLPREDGQCAVLLYDPDDDVVGWWRMQTLGLFENECTLPPLPGSPESRCYFIVKRTINGVVRRFIEKLAPRANCKGGLLNQLLDCHVTYQGVAVSTISLPHLPSTAVWIWADGVSLGQVTTDAAGLATLPGGATATNICAGLAGATETYDGVPATTFTGLSAYEGLTAEVFADQQPSSRMVRVGTLTVSAGVLTLPQNWTATRIVAFFGYQAPFMSAKLAYAAQLGSPLTQKKQLEHIGLVMFDTHAQGIKHGQEFDNLDDLPLTEEEGDVDEDTIWSSYDEPMVKVPGKWDTDARLCLLAQAPFPCSIGGVVVAVKTNEK